MVNHKEIDKNNGKCFSEKCNGYLNNKWVCGICDIKVCSKCHCIKEESHECNPDEVASIAAKKELGKPCPSCFQIIERTFGCNSMWCTKCHTFFDYETGRITLNTQYAHNPEHVAYMLQNGRNLDFRFNNQNICGINIIESFRIIMESDEKYKNSCRNLIEYHRISNEIRDHIRRYNRDYTQNDRQQEIRDLSVEFILGKITKSTLKTTIYRKYKILKKNECDNIRKQMCGDTIENILTSVISQIKNETVDIETVLKSTIPILKNVIDYTQKNLQIIGTLFNCKKAKLYELENE